jgi:hypothetical protein
MGNFKHSFSNILENINIIIFQKQDTDTLMHSVRHYFGSKATAVHTTYFMFKLDHIRQLSSF